MLQLDQKDQVEDEIESIQIRSQKKEILETVTLDSPLVQTIENPIDEQLETSFALKPKKKSVEEEFMVLEKPEDEENIELIKSNRIL